MPHHLSGIYLLDNQKDQVLNPYFEIRRKLITDLFDKFPELSIRGVARILWRDHPEFFNSPEHTRSTVRVLRGVNGKHNKKTYKFTKYYKDV